MALNLCRFMHDPCRLMAFQPSEAHVHGFKPLQAMVFYSFFWMAKNAFVKQKNMFDSPAEPCQRACSTPKAPQFDIIAKANGLISSCFPTLSIG